MYTYGISTTIQSSYNKGDKRAHYIQLLRVTAITKTTRRCIISYTRYKVLVKWMLQGGKLQQIRLIETYESYIKDDDDIEGVYI